MNSPIFTSSVSSGEIKTAWNTSFSLKFSRVIVDIKSSVAIYMISSTRRDENCGKVRNKGKCTKICIPLSKLQSCDIAPVTRIVVMADPTTAEVVVLAVP